MGVSCCHRQVWRQSDVKTFVLKMRQLLLLLLVTCFVSSRQLPFGTKLKRVRAKAQAPQVLINWRNFGGFLRNQKSLSNGYLPPPADDVTEDVEDDPVIVEVPVIDPEIPGVIIDPVSPVTTDDVSSDTPEIIITSDETLPVNDEPVNINDVNDVNDGVIYTNNQIPFEEIVQDIPYTVVNQDVINTDNEDCATITETFYEQIQETVCSLVNVTSCSRSEFSTDCVTTLEDVCDDVIETEVQSVCQENIVNVCDDVEEAFTRNVCSFVNDTKCETEYSQQYKDECTYETKFETVCSDGYLISYQDQCQEDGQGQQSCKKVPKYPGKECRKVPRVEGKCKKVPVLRPNTCEEIERVVCVEEPYSQIIRKCSIENRPICRQQPVDVVKTICNTIEKETCTVPADAENCQQVPENVCETKLVPFTRTIQRQECNNAVSLQQPNQYNSNFYTTSFL